MHNPITKHNNRIRAYVIYKYKPRTRDIAKEKKKE